MAQDLLIRPIDPSDKSDWAPLWRAYLAFYGTERSADQFDLTFARYCDPTLADMRGWLAWHGQKAVGLTHVIVHPHGWQVEPVTYIQDLYTDPDSRGLGVGRALIETVYADADAADRPSVYWSTQTGNTAARRLYDTVATPTDFMKYTR